MRVQVGQIVEQVEAGVVEQRPEPGAPLGVRLDVDIKVIFARFVL
jgi:hypothetical protein